ncbi:MAG: DUF1285 domain-containing protein [Alcanivorax sp.]|uniref:DUF1285 domain-containing protein n=1 Tax=Alloalcanivorax marinus TaxID=1177169 RepID=A0A9Q3YPY3_9GAMM|nr:DUF1285 domain-containing protein [Alloalcanivorax marinus]MBM7333852.1 DUF1285 domain-containing protein [Alloalcanivorax marinus]MCC4309270.1 DUF1285 domain-containing protein [Alloalcanivorax marinus]MCU5786622.1 hypothetical protein [Alloalcanivorax marinus]
MSKAEELLALLEKAEQDEQGLPPVHKWNPERRDDIDMRIASDGTWYYQGSPIERHRMVKLFSTILLREGDDYFLVTPVEKLRIQVDDVPFVATEVETVSGDGPDKLVFTTNVDAHVVAGARHPLRVETDPDSGEPRPYVHVRDNLEALIARTVFYRLVEQARREEQGDGARLVIDSDGQTFELGRL